MGAFVVADVAMPRSTLGAQPYSHRKSQPSYGFGTATRKQAGKGEHRPCVLALTGCALRVQSAAVSVVDA